MARIGDLNIRIGATIDGLRRGLQQAERSLQRSSRRMSDLGTRLTFTATASIGALGVSAVQTAAEFETLQNSLNILTGSAEEGAKAFERLKNFAGNTPLDLQDLMRANNTLMGFGLTADDAFNSFKQLGDISAVVGGDLQRIAVAYGQSIAANRVDARDILQFINNGVPIMEMLAEAMGVAVSEVKQLASEGKVTGDVLRKAMTMATTEGGKFYKGLETASQTLSGKFQKLKDNISLALNEIGQSIAEAINLREVIDTLIKAVKGLADGFKNLPDGVKKAIVIFAGFVAAVGPVLVAVASFKALLAGLAGSLAGVLAATTVVTAGVLALGVAIAKAVYHNNTAQRATKRLNNEYDKTVSKHLTPYISRLSDLSNKLEMARIAGQDFKDVQGALKKEFGDHIDNVDTLGGSYEELKKAIDEAGISVTEYSKNLAASQMVQSVQEELNELTERKGQFAVNLQETLGLDAVSVAKAFDNLDGTIAEREREVQRRLFPNGQGGINYMEAARATRQQNTELKNIIALEKSLNEQLEIRQQYLEDLGGVVTAPSVEVDIKGGGQQVAVDKERQKFLAQAEADRQQARNEHYLDLYNKETERQNRLAQERNAHNLKLYEQKLQQEQELANIEADRQQERNEYYIQKAIRDVSKRLDAVGEAFGAIGSFDQLDGFTNLFSGVQGLLEETAENGVISFKNMWETFKENGKAAVQATAQALAGITQGISSIISTAVSRDLESLDVSLQKQMKAIDQLNISEEAKQKHRLRAEERYNKQVAQLKAKQFRADKAAAIAQAAMNTAVGITQLIASGVGTALIPVVAALGSAQIAAIASQPVPQFANGGIVNGRTLAEVGEYGSAARGNPEVIAPLNKLKSMLGDMGGGNITGEFRLRGDDLVAAVEQANRKTARFSGTTQF